MNLKKNIYIHIEVLSRELPSQLLLSIFALKKNFRVHIGDLYSIKKLFVLKKNKEGIFISKGGLDQETHRLIKNKCEKLVSLDQEITPGFSKNYYKNVIKSRYSYNYKNFDLFFCINKTIKKSFVDSFNLNNKKVIPVGWPRFDLYRSKFKGLYKREVSILKRKYKKFYLFNSDFGLLSNQDRANQYKFLKKHNKDRNILKYILPKFNIIDFENFKKFLKSLKKEDKIPKIIIRPHPAENLIEWRNIGNINSNIITEIPKYDVTSMIIASEGVIHRGCSTGFQSIVYRKKTAYLALTDGYQNSPDFRSSLLKHSAKINSINSLKKWFCNKNKYQKENKEIIKILNIKKKYSCEKIINELEKLKISPNLKNYKFNLYEKNEVRFNSIKKSIYDFFSFIGIVNERDYFKKGSQTKIGNNFSKSNIFRYLNFFCKILNFKKNISVFKVTDNLFEIDIIN